MTPDPAVLAEAAAIHAAVGDGTPLELVPEPQYRRLLAIAAYVLRQRAERLAA